MSEARTYKAGKIVKDKNSNAKHFIYFLSLLFLPTVEEIIQP